MCWDNDNRDYDDLKRTDIAVYNYRGYTVLYFDKETKELKIGKNADMCWLIKDDMREMAKFLTNCYKFSKGKIKEIEHVEVN